jgi:acyl-CoA thioester hydrolase
MAISDTSIERANAVLVHETIVPMRWGDMDAMGHMNNTYYFRFMEEARIQWFTACGFKPNPQGEGPVIINAACSFLKQFEYPVSILCRTYLGKIGRSSFETYVDLIPVSPHSALIKEPLEPAWAQGSAKGVWTNFPAQKSAPLPPDALEQMRQPRLILLAP